MSTDELERRVDQLETKLETIQCLFSPWVLDKAQAHNRAKERDAREQLQVGEVYRVFVRDVERDGSNRQGIGRINGIVTFIKQRKVDFDKEDTVRVQLTDVKDNAAIGHAIERIE